MKSFVGSSSSVEELEAQILTGVYDYWVSLKRGDRLPDRAQLSPAKFKEALPHVFLIEVVDDGADYFHALAGEAVNKAHGYQVGKIKLSEALFETEEQRSGTRQFYDRIRKTEKPARITGDLTFLDKEHVAFEAVYLPMTDKRRGYDVSVGAIFGALSVNRNPNV